MAIREFYADIIIHGKATSSLTPAELDLADDSVLITKEYIAGKVSTGLERTEGAPGKFGLTIIGRDENNYGPIGDHAVDLSISTTSSTTQGATGKYAYAEGRDTTSSGNRGSHAEGQGSVASADSGSHAEGFQTTASGNFGSHAEGRRAVASGTDGSHAEGYETTASGNFGAHAEGLGTIASGNSSSHAEGLYTTASGGDGSHSEGCYTIALNASSHAAGKWNIGTYTNTMHETGVGFYDNTADRAVRKNAFEIFEDGTIVAPELTLDKINQTTALPNVIKEKILVTKEYVDANAGPKVTDITWADLVTKAVAGELSVWDKFIVTDMSNLPAEIKFIAPDGSCFIEVMDEAYIVELKKIE